MLRREVDAALQMPAVAGCEWPHDRLVPLLWSDWSSTSLGHDHAALSDHRDQVTLSANAGDAIVLDYRLLHGTHANASRERRDTVLLSLTPSWRELPTDVRPHLIQHLAQPHPRERPALTSWQVELCLASTARAPMSESTWPRRPPSRSAPERHASGLGRTDACSPPLPLVSNDTRRGVSADVSSRCWTTAREAPSADYWEVRRDGQGRGEFAEG